MCPGRFWELIDNHDEDCFGSIPKAHSTGGVERDHETAEASIEDRTALGLLARLRSYGGSREDGDVAVAWRLSRYGKRIWERLES